MTITLLASFIACKAPEFAVQSAAERWAAAPQSLAIAGPPGDPVVVQVTVRAGSAQDPPGQEGLAQITARALLYGDTREHSAAELAERFAALGVGRSVEVEPELARFTATVPPANFEAFWPLFAEQFTQPTLSDAALEAELALARDPLPPDALLGRALDHWVNQGHPYGHAPAGRESALLTLRSADLQGFYGRNYLRSSVAVGVVGAPPGAARLAEALAALPAEKPNPQTPKPRPVVADLQVLILPDPAASNAMILIGQPIALRGPDARLPALAVGIRALATAAGAEPPGPEHGLAEFQADRVQPHLALRLPPTGTESADEALSDALGRLDAALSAALDDAAVAAAIGSLNEEISRLSASPLARLRSALGALLLGLADPLAAWPAQLPTLDAGAVNAALDAALRPGAWRVVVRTSDPIALRAGLGEENPGAPVYAGKAAPARILTVTPEELDR